jgi:hypothetical protein
MTLVRQQTPRTNLEQAFSLAEQHLHIPRLLEASDVDCDRPDKRSIMTYVSQFMQLSPTGASGDTVSHCHLFVSKLSGHIILDRHS